MRRIDKLAATRPRSLAAALLALAAIGVGLYARGGATSTIESVAVRRETLTVTLTEAGVLRAAASTTYRSPLEGREVEVTYLAPEGTQVKSGDLIAQVDASALRVELERAEQALREAEMELQAADVDRREAALALQSLTAGAGPLAAAQARAEARLARARANRLAADLQELRPLLARGFITRDELERTSQEVDEAVAKADLAERALTVLVERTQPDEAQRATLQVTRREAQVEHLRPKVLQARAYAEALARDIERCAIRAARPGLIVYEDNLSVVPHRKIRVGDRVTPSQGLITLPDLERMTVETSVRESDVHLVHAGQRARVRLDAFPDREMDGVVARVGAVALRRDATIGPDQRFEVVVDLSGTSSDLRPAMNARVDITVASRADALVVPLTAVVTDGAASYCIVVRGRARERRGVEPGAASERLVEIVAGLRAGERVVVAPLERP